MSDDLHWVSGEPVSTLIRVVLPRTAFAYYGDGLVPGDLQVDPVQYPVIVIQRKHLQIGYRCGILHRTGTDHFFSCFQFLVELGHIMQ